MSWDALAARARGLGAHRLSPGELDRLQRATDLEAIAALIASGGYPRPTPPMGARAIERAVRQRSGMDLRILARWAGPHTGALDALFADEDRRSVRSILRGIAAGAAVEDRLASLVPTPELPAARLAELARQVSAGAVAERLIAWRNELGRAIQDGASHTRPDLFALERAIDRAFALRARRAARAGGSPVAHLVAHVLDVENAFAGLALAGGSGPVEPGLFFIEGGRALDRARFGEAVAAGPQRAASLLARSFPRSRLAAALAGGGDLEQAALADRIHQQARLARLQPASAAPAILVVLRRRAEAREIRRAVWRVAVQREAA